MAQEPVPTAVLAVAAAAGGALLGWVGARVLFVGSGFSLIPWSIVVLALGAGCRSRRAAVGVGGIFGFALAFSFMAAGYDGAAPLGTRLFPFVVLGSFGSVCGVALAMGGLVLRAAVSRGAGASRPE
jgi:hypothetical protein